MLFAIYFVINDKRDDRQLHRAICDNISNTKRQTVEAFQALKVSLFAIESTSDSEMSEENVFHALRRHFPTW